MKKLRNEKIEQELALIIHVSVSSFYPTVIRGSTVLYLCCKSINGAQMMYRWCTNDISILGSGYYQTNRVRLMWKYQQKQNIVVLGKIAARITDKGIQKI